MRNDECFYSLTKKVINISLNLPYCVKSKNGKMIFGNRIRELRESKGLLLRQLAAILEVDTATISKIERGERNMKREQVLKVSDLFNVDPKELLSLWLGEKIYKIVEEDELALNALKIAEQELKYIKSQK